MRPEAEATTVVPVPVPLHPSVKFYFCSHVHTHTLSLFLTPHLFVLCAGFFLDIIQRKGVGHATTHTPSTTTRFAFLTGPNLLCITSHYVALIPIEKCIAELRGTTRKPKIAGETLVCMQLFIFTVRVLLLPSVAGREQRTDKKKNKNSE